MLDVWSIQIFYGGQMRLPYLINWDLTVPIFSLKTNRSTHFFLLGCLALCILWLDSNRTSCWFKKESASQRRLTYGTGWWIVIDNSNVDKMISTNAWSTCHIGLNIPTSSRQSISRHTIFLFEAPRFPIEFWNVYQRVIDNLPRTNNSVEAWNRRISVLAEGSHILLYKLIDILRDENHCVSCIIASKIYSGCTGCETS
jgi:hypothetical protein